MIVENRPVSVNQGEKGERLILNKAALESTKHSLDLSAVTPSYGPWREDIINLLNDAPVTELLCVLRYKRYHFTAKGLASPKIAEESSDWLTT